jgi:murein DD-endopeptidase MepM/ murein hydrolase activator NlpD
MPAPATPYCWPLKPFGSQHPVRGYFNDPRNGEHSNAFHFGIDIAAPDGTAVYAVEPGTVHLEGPQNVSVVAPGGSHSFGYWHIVPVVEHLQPVRKNALLGHIATKWGHVHFAERRAG